MSSFKGSHIHSIDSKGRVHLPAKLRKHISTEANDTFVITRGFEQCIFAYPLDEWSIYEKAIRGLRSSSADNRFVMRTLLQYAVEVQLDGQSRIMLPQNLIQFAEIKNEVFVLGVLERIEIWNPEIFQSYSNQQNTSYEDVAEKVFKTNDIPA
jgi:MraZ protein